MASFYFHHAIYRETFSLSVFNYGLTEIINQSGHEKLGHSRTNGNTGYAGACI